MIKVISTMALNGIDGIPVVVESARPVRGWTSSDCPTRP